MKLNLKNILLKCLKKDKSYVLTHTGFINNCDITEEERESLRNLAEEIRGRNLVICFDNIAITPYVTSYNGGYVLAGIKFNEVEQWK
jgi:uncharacterized protein YbgA (DUF1722 family)